MKMTKRVTALLLAGLILMSAAACSNDGKGDESESTSGDGLTISTNLMETDTETDADTVENETTEQETNAPTTDSNINEENPSWTEKDCTVVVVTKSVLSVRKGTSTDSEKLGEVKDGTMLTSDAYSENWYRVSYKATEDSEAVIGYVSKKYVVEHNQELMDSFEECNEQVTIVAEISLNVRRYPDWDEAKDKNDLVCGSLKNGTVVTCVAKADGWYKVQVKTTAEGQVDMKDGTETREYYISANPKYSQIEADTAVEDTETNIAEETEAQSEAAN